MIRLVWIYGRIKRQRQSKRWYVQKRQPRLRTAILELPPRYRAVVECRHFQEMRYDEIAELLERPLSSVKSDLFRARKMLMKMLGEK